MRGLLSAVRTLTILSVPGRESEKLSSALPWFPFVGMLLAVILYGIGTLWNLSPGADWPSGGGALLLVASVILTRGLHLDGLADWADAVGACKGRPERLAIMRDPRLGTFGVVALILLLLTKWTGLTRLLLSDALIWLVPVWVIARDMMVELATTLPYARSGEGTARPFLEGASLKHRLCSHGLALMICLLFGPVGVLLLALGWGITGLLKIWFKKIFGGVTGDLLGTTNELVETALLLICALPCERIFETAGWIWL